MFLVGVSGGTYQCVPVCQSCVLISVCLSVSVLVCVCACVRACVRAGSLCFTLIRWPTELRRKQPRPTDACTDFNDSDSYNSSIRFESLT